MTLLIDEKILESGETERCYLELVEQGIRFFTTSGLHVVFSPGAMRGIMQRYAKPLDPDIPIEGPTLELSNGERYTLLHYRMHGRWAIDVIGKDYLVLEGPHSETLCALSNGIAGALTFIAQQGTS